MCVIASILCLFSLAHAVYGMIGMIGAIVGIAWASITGMLVCLNVGSMVLDLDIASGVFQLTE